MSKETLVPPLPPIDGRTSPPPNVCSGSNGHSARTPPKASTRNGRPHRNGSATDTCAKPSKCYPRPPIGTGATASDYKERMRVEYQELTGRADKLRDMLQRYADGTLDFEPTCPITLLSRQLDVMDEYALILRRRAGIEHISLGCQRIDTAARDAR